MNQQSASRPFDLDAREAEILGKPQRIRSLTAEEFDDEAKDLVARIRQSLRSTTTKLSSVFGLMLRHPGLFRCQMDMGIQLLGNGEIPPREREIAILRVGWLCGAPFEWVEHVVVAKRYEMTSEEIERVTQGSTAPGWNEHERAILKGVEELLGRQMISDDTWAVLSRSWSEKQLIEFPALVGQYFTIALQQNSLRVPLDRECDGLRTR